MIGLCAGTSLRVSPNWRGSRTGRRVPHENELLSPLFAIDRLQCLEGKFAENPGHTKADFVPFFLRLAYLAQPYRDKKPELDHCYQPLPPAFQNRSRAIQRYGKRIGLPAGKKPPRYVIRVTARSRNVFVRIGFLQPREAPAATLQPAKQVVVFAAATAKGRIKRDRIGQGGCPPKDGVSGAERHALGFLRPHREDLLAGRGVQLA